MLVALGAGASTVVAGAPVAASLLAPTGERTVRAGDDFIDVGPLDGILEDHPLRVTLRADRQDAWATFRNVELGSAWIVKGTDGGVTAFSTACPHLGCAVDWVEARDCFACPCHDGVFEKGGARVSGPAPRGLDRLECRVENGRVLVRFAKVRS